MRLKRVELRGFKSFADAAQLEISPGLTAIVGPNGCGKSNIVDAVRWVLGEQSWKTLRGSRLEDAIFSGSEGRRALSYTEVRLVIENDDGALPIAYHEVTVGRKGFRSGESRAFLNQTECRLRDLHELFLDTGLGGGAFAVVGQGEIDQILNAKPEELRTWLEETAGIAKVRAKRKEALKRLEETDRDLVRIEDLKAEGERRLSPMVQEAERAEAHRALHLEAARLETLLQSGRYRLLTLEGADRRARMSRLGRERDAVEEALAAAERERERMGAQVEELDRRLQDVGDRRSDEERRLAELRQQIALAEQERGHAGAERRQLEAKRAERRVRTRELQAECAEFTERLEELRRELEERRERLVRMGEGQAQDALRRHEQELTLRRESLLETVRARSSAQAVVGGVKERLADASSSEGALREALRKVEQRASEARHICEEQDARVEAGRARAGLLTRKRDQLRRSLREELILKRKASEKELHAVRERVQETSARLHALEEMERSLKGYAAGVKNVLHGRNALGGGICGVVADLIRVDERWETAIETALGGALQHIVVLTERDAEVAIEYLRRKRAGRATFLPLDTVRPRTPSREALQAVAEDPGAVGMAAALVEVDPRHQAAVDYLLARTVVVSDLDAGLRLSKRARGTGIPRIVTEPGDLLIPGGAITGGEAARRGAGEVWARRREQARLREQLAERGAERDRAEAALRDAEAAVEAAQGSLQTVEEELQQVEAGSGRDVEASQRAHGELANAEAAAHGAAEDVRRHEEADRAAGRELERALADLAEREKAEAEATRRVEAGEEAVRVAKEQVDAKAGELGELKLALTRREAELERVEGALEERRAELARTARADREDMDRGEALSERIRGLDVRAAELEHRLEEMEKEHGQSAEHHQRLRKERQMLAEAMADASDGEAKRRAALAEREQALQRLRIEEAEWEGRRRRLQDRLGDLNVPEKLWETLAGEGIDWSVIVDEVAAATDGDAPSPASAFGRAESRGEGKSKGEAEGGSEREGVGRGPTETDRWSPTPMRPALAADPPAPESDGWKAWEGECERALRDLRRRESGMGAVNPNAVAELREERERLAFLTGQRDDLVQAKESILEAVKEIDQTAEARLLETHRAVRDAFADLFAKLFDGGTADLRFVTPSHPLESGMEVRARPPGKRTQSLIALSGGERTLSAIALLFAAFRVKPSPFCVLDEIDAALDEVNLERFTDLLREFAREAQFIVITHRPRTMEEADNLYGVTMEESGVSKLVSVRLGTIQRG